MYWLYIVDFLLIRKRFLGDPWPENAIISLNQEYNVLNQEVRYRPLITQLPDDQILSFCRTWREQIITVLT